MAIEIERKFLIDPIKWEALSKPSPDYLIQGYLHTEPGKTIRVRATNDKGFITIKGKSSADGLSRSEFEYEIPKAEAIELLSTFTKKTIEKNRYKISFGGNIWEVDVFEGANAGLIVAEVELESIEQPFEKPDWVREEVTSDFRYFNSALIENPFKSW
ncbi:CYTH domain-containing protein [Cytophaga hutchinsonii]|jgi:adenylate cyclase|uniref:Adenylate cyclase n=1 Tax=Cytophaga hutchinsonii (strain ATCC 33406 / DSM 1761 / CIP 103989 / NBRC 15051 / NCIMB 9469 / D465) TaxID=269798 RepID=A0A6N4SMI1_CYTH3|nr:CYTH domain-containing protein [Cytophaga hutchinsonii]ABG57480.1 adenylate cyclase [Cytophaga hutchinsonii ATCC 33406]SFW98361.1 CYTH domain-containing protein [Cytophaga hutchinsonii ATCC 33406]